MTTQGPSPALFFDTLSAYQRTEALRAAVDLDLFTHLAAGRRTAAELAEAAQASPRGIRILADFLVIIGFLVKQGDGYELTADSKVFLDRKSPAYVGDATRFLLAPDLRESFERLTEAVRKGGTAISEEGTVSDDNPVWAEFARAIMQRAGLRCRINPIATSEYPTAAARPLNSRLSKRSLDEAGFQRLPRWEDALDRFLKEISE